MPIFSTFFTITTSSWCFFNNSFFIWHKETTLPEEIDLLVLPGGFAFGDRVYDRATGNFVISPGTMALQSPVSQIIGQAVEKNIPILGICNGFQILTQMKLLPGELILNECTHFVCKKVKRAFVSLHKTLIDVLVCVCVCAYLGMDLS